MNWTKEQVKNNMAQQQIVIIPGWDGTRKTWKNFIQLAEKDFEVHFIDMPCFGDEPCPKEIWGVDEYAEYVKNKILNLEKPILLGHSFGGQVAANLVANNSDLFSRLILSGAAVMRPKYTFKRLFFNIIAKAGKLFFSLPYLNKLENLAKKVLYKTADSPDYKDAAGIKREIFKKVIHQDQTYLLNKIKIKTLVVWGSRDSYVSLSEGKKIASLIHEAELKVIPDGKHGLHIQQPEHLLNIIKDFLK